MHVVSVNVGLPRRVVWRRREVTTGIYKEPDDGPVHVGGLNLAGDRQADLTVHGGADKAVYLYRAEHYPYWQEQLCRPLGWGTFGENLTVAGTPPEDEVAIGDRLRIGSAELVVTQPRLPCFKLALRFDDPAMVERFLAAGRSGYYLRVAKEGHVEAGDEIELLARHPAGVPVSEIMRLFARDREDAAAARRILAVDALPADWRPFFRQLAVTG
jgi:MOSC domain-containing protein YiiM